jgi:hypothetical protein
MRTLVRVIIALALAVVVLNAVACENSTPTPAQKQAIEQRVKGYLEALASAYSSLDATRLEPWASENEIAAVRKVLRTLMASGDRVDAKLLQVEFEDVEVFRMLNATVRTVEVWDVGRFDPYTGREKGRNPSSVQHAIVQLRLINGTWVVTARRVKESSGPNRWGLPTPEATSGSTE